MHLSYIRLTLSYLLVQNSDILYSLRYLNGGSPHLIQPNPYTSSLLDIKQDYYLNIWIDTEPDPPHSPNIWTNHPK